MNSAHDIVVSPDGQSVYIVDLDGAASASDFGIGTVAYRTEDGSIRWEQRHATDSYFGEPHELAVSPDGSMVAWTGAVAGEDGYAITTAAYETTEGNQMWISIFDRPGSDQGHSLRFDPDGSHVYVTGQSPGDGTSRDYVTLAYKAVSELGPSLQLPV